MNLFEQRHIAPMLIAEEKPAFDDPDWVFELKWDGTRCLAYLDPAAGIHLENKWFKILMPGFPELRGAVQAGQNPLYPGRGAVCV